MGQQVTKLQQQQIEGQDSRPGTHPYDPRSSRARDSCELRRVKSLIKSDKLGPCWEPLRDGKVHKCTVCMENYAKLNHTACCNQEICIECFVQIVSGSNAARCPYCQAEVLQVYLPWLSSTSRWSLSRKEAAQQVAPPLAPPAPMQHQQQQSWRSFNLAQRLAASISLFHNAECAEKHAAAATVVTGDAGSMCQMVSANGAPAQGVNTVMLLPDSLSLLAGPNRWWTGAMMGMVLTREPAPYSGSGSPVPLSTATSHAPRSSRSSSPASGSSDSMTAPLGPAGLASPAGGPALLINPDGTGCLVLLSSEEARRAQEQRQAQCQEAQAETEQPNQASYQAPATHDDQCMRAAIARSDAALRRQRPAAAPIPAAGPQGDWLERMRAADATMRDAIARSDAQHFGAGPGASGSTSTS